MSLRPKTALFWSLPENLGILVCAKKLLSGIVAWVDGFATLFFASFRLAILIRREAALNKVFFRSKLTENDYYSADPNVSVINGVTVVTWVLKKVGKTDKIVVNTKDLHKNYETCSPYEALGSHLV